MANNLQDAIGTALFGALDQYAVEHYARECKVIDDFIARGATAKIIAGALKNKYGISNKSMWLASYAMNKLEQKER